MPSPWPQQAITPVSIQSCLATRPALNPARGRLPRSLFQNALPRVAGRHAPLLTRASARRTSPAHSTVTDRRTFADVLPTPVFPMVTLCCTPRRTPQVPLERPRRTLHDVFKVIVIPRPSFSRPSVQRPFGSPDNGCCNNTVDVRTYG